MSYYRTCPLCGANLDPGERCDCKDCDSTDEDHNREELDHGHQTDPRRNPGAA